MTFLDDGLNFAIISFLVVLALESGEVGVDILRCYRRSSHSLFKDPLYKWVDRIFLNILSNIATTGSILYFP
jgi:hypothetical protein